MGDNWPTRKPTARLMLKQKNGKASFSDRNKEQQLKNTGSLVEKSLIRLSEDFIKLLSGV